MKTVYIALGSNLDNPLEQLKQAVESLKTFATNFEVSPFYGSKPVGPQDQPDYVNAVAKFETNLSALAYLINYRVSRMRKGESEFAAGENVRWIWILSYTAMNRFKTSV